MKGTSRSMILAAVLAPTLLADSSRDRATTVRVRSYNYAGVEDSIAKSAQRQAGAILDRAGVKTVWIDCAVTVESAGREPRCDEPFGNADVLLRLISDKMARKLRQRADTYGLAIPASELGLGTAFVFVHQAERLARSGPFPIGYHAARALVLGHLIAHEIGHLILGTGSHSSEGIMSFPWSAQVVTQIATKHLSFTRGEADTIRERLTLLTHGGERAAAQR